MSNLVLRAALSRPLTHNELDANMQFLEIVEWSVKDFRAGQFAYRTVSNVTSLYLCLETHTQFVYDITDGEFAETITIEGTSTRLWRKISGSGGGGGTGAEFVAAEFDPDTNILTFTTVDGDPVTVDLSSLAGGGTGTSGSSGASGTSGSSGVTGSSGSSGITGSSGSSGVTGTSGVSGDKYKTTSTTSHTLGSSGTITVETGLSYSVAQSIIIAYNGSNFQESEVVSYNSSNGSLVFGAPTRTVGSGTYTSWSVNLDGASGGDGSSGTSGAKGTSGSSGVAGTSGVSGTSGNSGSSGTSGGTGSSGTSGANGTSGIAGSSGTAGVSGSSGTSGSSGNSGSSGTSGAKGTSGSSGTAGVSGSSGTSGSSDNYLGTVLAPIDYSTLTVGTPLIVTTTTNLSYSPGETVVIAYDGSNYVNGTVLTYNTGTGQLAVTILNVVWGTSGNLTPSQSNLQGLAGATGSSGSSGGAGAPGSSGTSGANGVAGTSGSSGETGATGSSGSSGASGTSGAAGAPGTSGTSAAGGASGVYFVKLQYASGSLAAAPGCFVAAEDPSGTDLLTAPGWVFTRVGANEITITHPEGKFAINAMTHAENTSGNYLSKAVSGASTGVNSLIQAIASKDSMNFKALSGTQTGLNTGAGPFYMYITWTYPDNDFAI